MERFKYGVNWYSTGKAVIEVAFPEDQVLCCWCPFCRAENDLGRYWCRLTNRMIYDPFSGIGDGCPIQFDKEGADV